VLAGLSRAAEREPIELITVNNRYQAKIALRSADYLIREQVDLIIEFQTDEASTCAKPAPSCALPARAW